MKQPPATMDNDSKPRAPASRKIAIAAAIACAALLLLFAIVAWLGARDKNATFDEPNDSIEAWIVTRYSDYRISPADPPLAYYWAAIPQSRDALKADFQSPHWNAAAHEIINEHLFSTDTLYRTPGNDADAFIARSRFMMLLLAVAMGAVIAIWSWRIGGPVAAVAAIALFSLDPNFLAHAPLVKNDVAIGLVFIAMMAVVWQIGRQASVVSMVTLALLCGAALCVKFNGLVLGPCVAAAIVARTLMPQPWIVLGKSLRGFSNKLPAAAGILLFCLVISYGCIWACYRFRFGSSPDPSVHLESDWVAQRYLQFEYSLNHPNAVATPGELAAMQLPVSIRIALFLEHHRLLPEPWTNGLIRNVEGTRARECFLMGQYSDTGWWYYFPLTVLFKTPLATLAAFVGAICLALFNLKQPAKFPQYWIATCLAIPILIYGGAAMFGNLNLGIRHLLPIYPFAFIAVGLACAAFFAVRPILARSVAIILIVALAIETFCAFPDFIPFFNVVAGGSRGGLGLLSDSNIDWGQDLRQLVAWQRGHPDRPLYLCYFGTADPNYYGLRYINMSGSDAPAPSGGALAPSALPANAIVAISATQLQGTYLDDKLREIYAPLRDHPPLAVLGGSIYLFDLSKP